MLAQSNCRLSFVFKVSCQRTSKAVGCFAAVRLADGYGQGVELVEEAGVPVGRVLCECLLSKGDQGLVAFAAGVSGEELMALGDAA